MNEWMNLTCLRHTCNSYRIVVLHYDPLDQHNLAGVFRVFLTLGHHHLHHHFITSHVSDVNPVLLRAYLRAAASFQRYRRVQPCNRPQKKHELRSVVQVTSSNKQTVPMKWCRSCQIPVTWLQRAQQRSRAARACNCEQLFLNQLRVTLRLYDDGLGWSGLRMMVRFLTGRVTELRHALVSYQRMLLRRRPWRTTLHCYYKLL